jgi:hypothetical protein
MEYFAAGLPVVTTAVGVRGLDIVHQRDAIVCPIKEFPDRLRQLAHSETIRFKIGTAARRFVEERYDWRRIAARAAEAIESIMPPIAPPPVTLQEQRYFKSGWYSVEHWPVNDDDLMEVRWTEPVAQLLIPDMRKDIFLQMQLLGPSGGTGVQIRVNGNTIFRETIFDQWTPVKLPLNRRLGFDWHTINIQANPWSPSDHGSPDNRQLGIAVTNLKILENEEPAE